MTNRVNTLMTNIAIITCLLFAPMAVDAQQAEKVLRIGLLWSISRSSVAPYNEAFRQSLRELGYIEGKNVILEHRYRGRTTESTPEVSLRAVEIDDHSGNPVPPFRWG